MDIDYETRITRLMLATLMNLAELTEIDIEEPMVTLEKPLPGYLYLNNREILRTFSGNTIIIGMITATAQAIDNISGLQKIEFFVDGTRKAVDDEPPYSWTWNERVIGEHVIRAKAYDYAGNWAADEITIKIFNIG
jgi:hypothetical protein